MGAAARCAIVAAAGARGCWPAAPRRAAAAARRAGAAQRAPTTASCGTWSRATPTRVADVDLAALRASPWSERADAGSLDGEREERRRRFGYDVFTEAERMVVAGDRGGRRDEHADDRARPLRRRARRRRVPGRGAGRGRDAVAEQPAVGGAGAGGRARHAAHARAGDGPRVRAADRRRLGRGRRTRAAARSASCAATLDAGQESARRHHRRSRSPTACARAPPGCCRVSRTGCGGSARG